MKKISILLFIFIIAAAIAMAGCLGNDVDDGADDSVINSSNDSNNDTNSPDLPEAKSIPPFGANLSKVDPVPPNFSFLSTATVKSHGQHIGITDALFGYQGIYHYGSGGTPVFLTYYDVAIATTSKTSATYIQNMIDSHQRQYGSDSNVSIIQFNGHDAVLLTAETAEVPQYGRCILTWTLGDSMFVTVTGNINSDDLIELAKATGY